MHVGNAILVDHNHVRMMRSPIDNVMLVEIVAFIEYLEIIQQKSLDKEATKHIIEHKIKKGRKKKQGG
jgi:hypothetical protein